MIASDLEEVNQAVQEAACLCAVQGRVQCVFGLIRSSFRQTIMNTSAYAAADRVNRVNRHPKGVDRSSYSVGTAKTREFHLVKANKDH